MEYSIYKLDFQTEVHFGMGMLNESDYTFGADQLFSALFIEALKWDKHKELYQAVNERRLLFSDAFPYIKGQYMLPKPMIYIEPVDKGRSEKKKQMKKMKFLPVEELDSFLNGTMEIVDDPMKGLGAYQQRTKADVRNGEETVPYRVGTFLFEEKSGLYVIVAYQDTQALALMEELMESLSYTGIGGKKNTGLGKFILRKTKMPETLLQRLNGTGKRYMLLSSALPEGDELDMAMEGTSYNLVRRSGYIASPSYADEWKRKKDLFVFAAGSCFEKRFKGNIYDVSIDGRHPVFRYEEALFMEV